MRFWDPRTGDQVGDDLRHHEGPPMRHAWSSELPTTAGTASFALPIPALLALAGQVLGAQAFSFDTQASSGFAAVSNGAILRLY